MEPSGGGRAGDIEAPASDSNGRLDQQEEQATARTEAPPATETHPAEPSDAAASPATSPTAPLALEAANLPFLALVVTATAALIYIVSDIIVNHTIHPASTGVFLLLSLCWVIFKRHNPDSPSEEGSRGGTLTKEARDELLTYFVFPGSEAETGAGARGTGDAQRQAQLQQQLKGSESAGVRDVLQESRTSNRSSSSSSRKERGNGSRGWRWMGNGDNNNDGGEAGARARDNPFDADDSGPFPAGTAGPSPCPPSPCPPPPVQSGQPFDLGGCGLGCALSSAAPGGAATDAGITQVVRELLQEEKEKEGQEETIEQAESRESDQPRSGGSSPPGGRKPVINTSSAASSGTEATALSVTAAAAGPAGATPGASGSDEDCEATKTPSTFQTVSAPPDETLEGLAPAATTQVEPAAEPAAEAAAANVGSGLGHSDSGEWSTDRACIVCFGDYAPGDLLCRLPCRHVYHAECINEWLDRAKVPCCPLCKTDLLLSLSEGVDSAAAARSSGGAAVHGVEGTTGEAAV